MRYFNFPKEWINSRNIPKETLYKFLEADEKLKKLFIDNVERIRLEYLIAQSNSNIEKFVSEEERYEEIHFYTIELRKKGYEEKIANLLHGIIPKATVIELKFENEWKLSVTRKNISNNRIKIDEVFTTAWITEKNTEIIESLNFSNFNSTNLKFFYESISDRIKAFNSSEVLGVFSLENIEENKEKTEDIMRIKTEIEALKKELNKEKHNFKKAEIIKKIKKMNEELKKREV